MPPDPAISFEELLQALWQREIRSDYALQHAAVWQALCPRAYRRFRPHASVQQPQSDPQAEAERVLRLQRARQAFTYNSQQEKQRLQQLKAAFAERDPQTVLQFHQAAQTLYPVPLGVQQLKLQVHGQQVQLRSQHLGAAILPATLPTTAQPLSSKQAERLYQYYLATVALILAARVYSYDPALPSLRWEGYLEGQGVARVQLSRPDWASLPTDPMLAAQALNIQLSPRPLAGVAIHGGLLDMNPFAFEALIAELYRREGWCVEQTPDRKDGGVDVIARPQEPWAVGVLYVQVKRYRHPVGVADIRALYGIISHDVCLQGVLVTTSRFTQDAQQFAANKPIALIDGRMLYQRLQSVGLAEF